MLNVLIVDDEYYCRKILKKKIKMCEESINIVGEKSNIEETITFFKQRNQKIDILFLDIEMPNGTGFDLLERMPNIDVEVIFTTSYHEFALRSFRYNVIDYLIKPIKKAELDRAIKKVKERFLNKDTTTRQPIYKTTHFGKVSFPTSTGIEFVPFKDIIHCEASGAYTFVYIYKQPKITVSKNLAFVEEQLSEEMFLRISRSHLINLAYLKNYDRSGYITLEDGTIIEVPRRKRDDFLNFFKR